MGKRSIPIQNAPKARLNASATIFANTLGILKNEKRAFFGNGLVKNNT
jgi:hypothetical protein